MDPFLAIIGLIGAVAVASIQSNSQKETNEQNVALQHEAWEQQSITHRVEELEANGLNKQLATGMNPNYTLQTAIQNPMGNFGQVFQYVKDLMGSDYTYQQSKNARIQNEILSADKTKAEAEAEIAQHDANVITNREGVASNDPALTRLIPGVGDMIFGNGQTSNWLREIGEAVKSLPDKAKARVYEETPDWAKPFVFATEYKYEKQGGVLSGHDYTGYNVTGGSGDSYQELARKGNAKKGNSAYYRRYNEGRPSARSRS